MADHRRYELRYPCMFLPANPVDVEAAVAVSLTAAARLEGWEPTAAAVIDFHWVENADGTAECRASLPVIPTERTP